MGLKKVASILGIFSVLSIIGISFLTWRFCDDFRFEKVLRTKGVFEYMNYLYMTFDGRFLSLAAFIQLALIKYLNLKFVVFIWSLFFVADSILILRIIFNELNYSMKIKTKEIVFIISIISVSLFYGFYKHISETVFWAVGGAYMLNAFLGLLWIVFYRNVIKMPLQWYITLLYSIFSFVVGMLTQNLVICLFTLLFIEGILLKNRGEKKKILLLCLSGSCLLIGFVITSFSPGSLYRVSLYTNSFDTNPINYIKYFYDISKVFLRASIYLIPLSIFSAIAIFVNLNLKIPKQNNPSNKKFVNMLISLRWLIIATASIFPFLFVPQTVCYRTSLFFMIFLFIFILASVIKILSKLERIDFFKYKKTINISLLIIFVCHLIYMSYCYKIGHDYQTYMEYTDRYLRTQKNSSEEIVIKNKKLPCYPFMFNIKEWSLTDNPDNWINMEWSFYYDIKRLRTE